MVYNEAFWVAVAFIALIGMFYKPIASFIIRKLDERSARIDEALTEALRLKEEAQAILSECQRKREYVLKEAEDIIKFAEVEATRVLHNAEKQIDEIINRRIETTMQKMAGYEASIISKIKNKSLDTATEAVKTLLSEKMDDKLAKRLAEATIVDISKKIH